MSLEKGVINVIKKKTDWNHGYYEAAVKRTEQFINMGNLRKALDEVRDLVARCLEVGEEAYPDAGFDTAEAYFLMGRILEMEGAAAEAATAIDEAYHRFQRLADQGNSIAAVMAASALAEKKNSLMFLSRLEGVVSDYEKEIRMSLETKDWQAAANGHNNLGIVQMLQGHYDGAIHAFSEALKIFVDLGDHISAAATCHKIGMAHEEADRLAEAEHAYRLALSG